MNYYNEWNPYAADWLRNLIDAGLERLAGHVDDGHQSRRLGASTDGRKVIVPAGWLAIELDVDEWTL